MKFDPSGRRLPRSGPSWTSDPPATKKPYGSRFIEKSGDTIVSITPPGVFYCPKCGYKFKTYNKHLVDNAPGHDPGMLYRLHYLAKIHVRLDSNEGWEQVAKWRGF